MGVDSPANPVLAGVRPLVEGSRDVATDTARLAEVASWLAYEELPVPPTFFPFPFELERDETIDFVLVTAALNFAYTDFVTRRRWDLVVGGRPYADADGLHFAFHRAHREGLPVLEGEWLAQVDAAQLGTLLPGLQMLDERAAIMREIGAALCERWDGRFHRFFDSCPPRLYDGGNGFLESLVREFPRFDDTPFWKLAQLAVWIMEITLGGLGFEDLHELTAFADYIVPAGLHVMGVLQYSDPLERAIREGRLIEAGSPWELEVRAHTVHACHELTRAVNALRPPELHVIVPQIDARFWLPFHKTHAPHHLTRTIYY
jgi:Potential Queuosine, Q, salvage protein family